MIHAGDVEQEMFDPSVLRVVKAFLHLDAPLPYRMI
jgi:hypothetical protein